MSGIVVVVVVAALIAGGRYFKRHYRRPESAKTESSLVLEPERDEAKAVARALARGIGGFWRGPKLRSFDFVVESKNGSSAVIAEAIAARLVGLGMALSVRKSDMVTLKARVRKNKAGSAGGEGRLMDAT